MEAKQNKNICVGPVEPVSGCPGSRGGVDPEKGLVRGRFIGGIHDLKLPLPSADKALGSSMIRTFSPPFTIFGTRLSVA